MYMNFEQLLAFKPRKDTYFVFGYPISHSLSPALHKIFFEINNIDAEYLAVEISPAQLKEAISAIKPYAKGVNLTIPLKEIVLPFIDEIDDSASEIGAVNTLLILENGKNKGFNTDCYGLLQALKTQNYSLSGKDVLILGNGGVSRAFLNVSLKLAKSVTVCGRDINKVNDFCGDTNAKKITFSDLDAFFSQKERNVCVLNGTPVGMGEFIGKSPINIDIIKKCEFIFDSIYNPFYTNLLSLASVYNIHSAGGLYMLIFQGLMSEEIWGNKNEKENTAEILYENLIDKLTIRSENIVLTGYMGSGKTTVGNILAEKLNKMFVDIDSVIEDSFNISISEIFEERGEEEFRRIESEICEKVSRLNGAVISTGGGIIKNLDNIKSLKQNGKIFFLNTSLDEIKKRLREDQNRPLIKDKENIEKIYSERLKIYKETADFIINAQSSEEMAEEIQFIIHNSQCTITLRGDIPRRARNCEL